MDGSTQAIIRDARSGSDHAFLYSTWRNALWYSEKREQKLADQFYKEASERISSLLKLRNIKIRMACLNEDPDMLLGWAVMQDDHLYFAYVKIDYRRKGIGNLLVRGFTTFSPPETKIGKSLAEKFIQEKNNGRKEESQTPTT